MWLGKIIGGLSGYLLSGGSLVGAFIGGFFGHLFDKGMAQNNFVHVMQGTRHRQQVQQVFFKTVFTLLGCVAKADGRVTSDEIQAARAIMQQMMLNEDQVQQAISFFSEGKQAGFSVDQQLDEYILATHRNRMLSQMLLEILIHGALADGVLHVAENAILQQVGKRLGYAAAQVQQFIQMVQAQQYFHQHGADSRRYSSQPRQSREQALKEAYAVLGVEPSASDAEVKKAYRRQMNQHHPDKLASKGLPEEMIKLANEKTHEIKTAYELIVESRKK